MTWMGDDGRIQTLNRCDKSPEPQNRIPVLRNLLTSNHLRPHNFGHAEIDYFDSKWFLKQIKPELNYELIVMRLDFISIVSFLFKAIGYRSRKDYDMTGPWQSAKSTNRTNFTHPDSSPFVTAENEISRTSSIFVQAPASHSFTILSDLSVFSVSALVSHKLSLLRSFSRFLSLSPPLGFRSQQQVLHECIEIIWKILKSSQMDGAMSEYWRPSSAKPWSVLVQGRLLVTIIQLHPVTLRVCFVLLFFDSFCFSLLSGLTRIWEKHRSMEFQG